MTKYPMSKADFIGELQRAIPMACYSGTTCYKILHATMSAAVEGRQKKGSAGWWETEARCQKAVLKALKR